ncbi:MAG: hypothetical protein A4E51_01257 [Methanosaeta sp. PtaU1.Bin055]|nr:MAG: hypothetical protein A4E51_01257 [Methanosaeta sp. PtaU1.Bin055]
MPTHPLAIASLFMDRYMKPIAKILSLEETVQVP